MSRLLSLSILATALTAASGCGSLMGNLRQDLDNGESMGPQATYGGSWQERGFLSESMGESGRGGSYGSLNHSDRAPAALYGGGDSRMTASGSSWLDQDQEDAHRRDALRNHASDDDEEMGPPSYRTNPNMAGAGQRNYKSASGRASRSDFVDESQSEGSLWASDGQTNYYFTKNKVRGKGDIVTVKLENDMVRDFGMEIRRTLSMSEKTKELSLAQNRIRTELFNKDAEKEKAGAVSAAERKPAAKDDIEVPTASFSDIDVTKSLELKENDTVLSEIVERYPNGNYKIRGTKKVAYKNGSPRLMTMIAVVRSADIGEDDVVSSGKLYEYRLEALR